MKANVYHIDTKDSYIIVGLVPIVTYYNQKVDAIAGGRFVTCPNSKDFCVVCVDIKYQWYVHILFIKEMQNVPKETFKLISLIKKTWKSHGKNKSKDKQPYTKTTLSNKNPIKNRDWSPVHQKGKQIRLNMQHASCPSFKYKPGYKSNSKDHIRRKQMYSVLCSIVLRLCNL